MMISSSLKEMMEGGKRKRRARKEKKRKEVKGEERIEQ